MKNNNGLRVRPISADDFAWIVSLASGEKSFTVPPSYVLWMLSEVSPATCFIAEDNESEQVGYALSLLSDTDPKFLFVWQLAVTDRGRVSAAAELLAQRIVDVALAHGLSTIRYSANSRASSEKWISILARRLTGNSPRQIGHVPTIGATEEMLYEVSLDSNNT